MVSPLASSESRYNNYELLDVLLFENGRHRIVIPQTVYEDDDGNKESNVIGIAMTLYKQIYIPNVTVGLVE